MTVALIIIGFTIAAIAVGALVATNVNRQRTAPGVPEEERQRLLEAAQAEAEQIKRKAELAAQEITVRAKEAVDKEIGGRRAELERSRGELTAKAESIAQRGADVGRKEEDLNRRERSIVGREQQVEAATRKADEALAEAKARLEKIAGMTPEQAREQLQAQVIDAAKKAAAEDVKRIEAEATAEAESRSKRIIATAIQRYAAEYVAERTVAVVALPSDDIKGRIIGREGRNIRALEAATGIDLIIDDTPDAVIVSCFHPVRREVARLALARLISDGRIHPTRIEEVVGKCEAEIDQQCKQAGEQAIFDLGLAKIHPELIQALGQMKFRSSYGQNQLQHSVETGFLAGVIAGELGVNVKLARRAGLLHDVGKSVDHEVEGSHAAVGAAMAKRLGESPKIVQAIAAHHGEVPPQSLLDHVVDAANQISAQRPGARRELLQSYVSRLADLEKLCAGFPGVDKVYAIQAGKEVRVLVENAQISDDQVAILSREIARRIEDSLAYPGQIRVCVIRETRATDYAK